MMSSSFTFNILFNLSNHSGVISLSVKYPLFLLSVGFAVAVVIYPSVLDCDSSINASNKTRAIDITSCTHYCILSYWKCKAYHKKNQVSAGGEEEGIPASLASIPLRPLVAISGLPNSSDTRLYIFSSWVDNGLIFFIASSK
jgi:hypothetical protein